MQKEVSWNRFWCRLLATSMHVSKFYGLNQHILFCAWRTLTQWITFSMKAAIFCLSPVTQTNVDTKWTSVKYLKISVRYQYPLLPFSLAFLKNQSCSLNSIKTEAKYPVQRLVLHPLYLVCQCDRNRYDRRGAEEIYSDGKCPFSDTEILQVKFYPNTVHWKKLSVLWLQLVPPMPSILFMNAF